MKAAQARVLLTGATGGIGQAMAQALVSGGASVMLAGRRDDTLKALARRIDPGAAHTVCQQADLLQPQGVAGLAAAAAHQRLRHGLANAAGRTGQQHAGLGGLHATAPAGCITGMGNPRNTSPYRR